MISIGNEKIARLNDRFAVVEAALASGTTGDAFVRLSKEYAELEPVIRAARGLEALKRERLDQERSAVRRGQVGSGDRSERIRTYNFPQGRVTDHRINLTLYKLDLVMEGPALEELVRALVTQHHADLLAGRDGNAG